MPNDVLTVEEVAQILRVSIPTVRKLIKEKQLKAFNVGNQKRVMRSELERYMQRSS